MTMFNDGNRALQDKYAGRAVADRIVELVETATFTDQFRAFVEAVPFFFLATSAAGNTDCSFRAFHPFIEPFDGPNRFTRLAMKRRAMWGIGQVS